MAFDIQVFSLIKQISMLLKLIRHVFVWMSSPQVTQKKWEPQLKSLKSVPMLCLPSMEVFLHNNMLLSDSSFKAEKNETVCIKQVGGVFFRWRETLLALQNRRSTSLCPPQSWRFKQDLVLSSKESFQN